ncbi:MAG: signal peptidase II, partial [Hungateiclostridium thermocellum]|nr:signal peptidase II [Acetivibrio thermocellus]
MIFIVLIAAFVAADQLTKYIVVRNIEFGDKISVIDNFFYLTHWRNTGAAWGIMQNGRYILVHVTVVLS